jgi:hypothetical protein
MTTTIANNSAPASFDVLLDRMMPHFKFFAQRVRRPKGIDIEDIIQDLSGMALLSYNSLVRRGKEVFFSPILNYAIKHYRQGRRFTGSNSTDVHSEETQRLGRSKLHQLSEYDDEQVNKGLDTREFMEDRRVNVADTVQFVIDYEDWLSNQSARDQQIIKDLSYGYTTGDVAKKYAVSDGLISQYRKRYGNSWKTFIDPAEEGMAVPA